ncbi:WD40-repeat-containing domain protein [Lactarius indigo]|nr:WD40-repeat-containing domain protein [Lactarius indigo]
MCDTDMFPRNTTAILLVHTDEVWCLEWSHNGKFLASASKDSSVIIWSVGPNRNPDVSFHLHLQGHPLAVTCLAWSPDDTILFSSSEQHIKMWNTETGMYTQTIEAHTETVPALAWVPDGSGFISGSQDQSMGKTCKTSRCPVNHFTRHCYVLRSDGKQRDSWGIAPIRIADLVVTPDGMPAILVALFSGVVFSTRRSLGGYLTSAKISSNSQYALVNRAPDEMLLLDLSTGGLTRKYMSQRQARHVIRSCFGGVDDNFVASGSEDGNIVLSFFNVLTGHGSDSVNSVAWNPRNTQMFASCSDDYTIRPWEPSSEAESSSGLS